MGKEHPLDDSEAAQSSLATSDVRDLRVPCYCEENVWRLAYRNVRNNPANNKSYWVVFVSNEQRCCPMLAQRASACPDRPCFWDYHVIFLDDSAQVVWDVDSHMPFPCPVADYLHGTFRNLEFLQDKHRATYAPLFRVVRAELFLQYYYSDRRHMWDASQKVWQAPPPSYECIMTGWDGTTRDIHGNRSNLSQYIDMSKRANDDDDDDDDVAGTETTATDIMGTVLTLDEFKSKFE